MEVLIIFIVILIAGLLIKQADSLVTISKSSKALKSKCSVTSSNSNPYCPSGVNSQPHKSESKVNLFPSSYVVVDVETTGLSNKTNEIIEIGAIKIIPRELDHEYMQYIVLADNPIPNNIVKLTGITQEMVDNGIDLKTAITELKSFIGSLPIVAFNASFDMGFLQAAAKKHGLLFNNEVYCALELSKLAFPGLESYKLDYLSKIGGIKSSQSHRALDDCKCAAIAFNGAISVLIEQGFRPNSLASTSSKKLSKNLQANKIENSKFYNNYIQSLDESVFNINKGTSYKVSNIEDVIYDKNIELNSDIGFYMPETRRFHYLSVNSKNTEPLPQTNFIPKFSKLKKKHNALLGKVLNVDVVPKFIKSREELRDVQLKLNNELLSKVIFDDIEDAASACFGIDIDDLISLTEDGYAVKKAIADCSISLTIVVDYQGVIYPVVHATELDIFLNSDEMVTPNEILITHSAVESKTLLSTVKPERFKPLPNFDTITNKLFIAISNENWGGVNAAITLGASLTEIDHFNRNALAYSKTIGNQSIINLIRKYS